MRKDISLREFVRNRNGLPLGAPGSLPNMLFNAFGASSFDRFWWYWNPIWGYYLSKRVLKPCRAVMPLWAAMLVTFIVSGALHDLAIALVRRDLFVLFTPWFGLMGMVVSVSKSQSWSYRSLPFIGRVIVNSSVVIATFLLTRLVIACFS